MTGSKLPLDGLIELSRKLGDPTLGYAILGEGNTSCLSGGVASEPSRLWVKASGRKLANADRSAFVEVNMEPILELLSEGTLPDSEIRRRLIAAKCDGQAEPCPSVETLMHAVFLAIEGIEFVGHTHPIPINQIACSVDFMHAVSGRLFPDEIVVCGPAPVVVPYVDPGIPLAHEIHRQVYQYLETWGERPKTVYLQNHGFVALGSTAQEVENITAMAVKTAVILQGTAAFGGPNFLEPAQVARIHGRPDEHYRQRVIDNDGPGGAAS